MKGTINDSGKRTGGDMGFCGKPGNMNQRNIKRLIRKYPNNVLLQKKLHEELEKYK